MLADCKRQKLDLVVCWSLDRLGRSLKHLVVLLDDLQASGVGFVLLREGLDWTTPSGKPQAQLLAMVAEFERARISGTTMFETIPVNLPASSYHVRFEPADDCAVAGHDQSWYEQCGDLSPSADNCAIEDHCISHPCGMASLLT